MTSPLPSALCLPRSHDRPSTAVCRHNERMRRGGCSVSGMLAALLTVGGPASAAAQSQTQTTTPPASTQSQPAKPSATQAKPDPSQQDAMPVDVERIKNALKNIPSLHLD